MDPIISTRFSVGILTNFFTIFSHLFLLRYFFFISRNSFSSRLTTRNMLCFLLLLFFFCFVPTVYSRIDTRCSLPQFVDEIFLCFGTLIVWLILLFESISLESALTDVFCFISFSFNFYCIYFSVAFRHLFIIYFSLFLDFFFLHRGRWGMLAAVLFVISI